MLGPIGSEALVLYDQYRRLGRSTGWILRSSGVAGSFNKPEFGR